MTEHPCLAFWRGCTSLKVLASLKVFLRLKILVPCLALAMAGAMPGSWLRAQESPMAAPTYPVDDEPEGATLEASTPNSGKIEPEKVTTPTATAGAAAAPTAKYSIVVAPLPPQRPFVMVSGAPASDPAPAAPASVAAPTASPPAGTETAKVEPSQSGGKPAPEAAEPRAVAEPAIAAPSAAAPPQVEPPVIETEPNMRIASLTITTQPATTEDIEAEEEKAPEPMIVEKQTDSVNITCLQPEVFKLIRQAGEYFGGTPIITSGQRDRGRRGSYHRKCMAADFFVPGIERARLAKYLRTLPGAGGVGTYCHTKSVHIDTGEPRNWWQCGLRFRFAQR